MKTLDLEQIKENFVRIFNLIYISNNRHFTCSFLRNYIFRWLRYNF